MSDSPVLLKVCKTMGQMGQMQKIITNTIIKNFPILTFDPNNSTVDHFCYQFPYAIKVNPKITLRRLSFAENWRRVSD